VELQVCSKYPNWTLLALFGPNRLFSLVKFVLIGPRGVMFDSGFDTVVEQVDTPHPPVIFDFIDEIGGADNRSNKLDTLLAATLLWTLVGAFPVIF